jgi:hypothetical protein
LTLFPNAEAIMTIAMTNCYFCEKAMPMGAAVCPNCSRPQKGATGSPAHLQRVLIAIVLSVAVLIVWQWLSRSQAGP